MDVSKATLFFFKTIENDLQLQVSSCVKNILNASGFNCAIVFKHFTRDSISNIEKFAQTKLPSALEAHGLKNGVEYDRNKLFTSFFGRYSRTPSEFKFSEDECNLLMKLARHVKIVTDAIEENSGLHHFQYSHEKDEILEYTNSYFEDDSHRVEDTSLVSMKSRTHTFLRKLVKVADANVNRVEAGYRFDDDIRDFAAYIRMLAGRKAYQTIHRNLELAIPSLSSIDRFIRQTKDILIEGQLRSKGLLRYLRERNLPLVVALSEDATRIDGRPQYHSMNNEILGFVLPLDDRGMPIPHSFRARSAAEMFEHFSTQRTAHFVNVIMAQPMGNFAPYCLLLFASGLKYTASTVFNRWKFIIHELEEIGISVLTFSSDSDPRYNSAMRQCSGLGDSSYIFGDRDWFQCAAPSVDGLQGPFYVQDTVHIGTKLRCCLLKTWIQQQKLPFGNKFYVDIRHLETILDSFTKDQHRLTATALDLKDKQNFDSVLKICDENVSRLLEEHVPESVATRKFLEVIRNLIEAFSEAVLSPLDRIDKIWHATFILRLWRQYIISCPETTLKKNFISQNCYVCVELNAHSLVLLLLYLKQNDTPTFFLPFFFNSQPCESFFRKIRSFTSTYSTVASCSIKEIIGRVNKIQLQGDISYRSRYQFPRSDNTSHAIENEYILPTKKDIKKQIEKSKKDAFHFAREIGITNKENISDVDFSCHIPPYLSKNKKNYKQKNHKIS